MALELRRARMIKGLSMREVAKAIGAEYATYAKWEGGKNEPQARIFIKWCLYLGVDPVRAAQL